MKPLYKGGVIQNSEFNSGLMGWSTYRNIKAGVSSSPSGNKFAVVRNAGSFLSSSGRFLPSRSVYQRVHMQGDMHYSLSGMYYTCLICRELVHFLDPRTCASDSCVRIRPYAAWLQVSNGTAHVKAVVKAPDGERVVAGAIFAQSGCWSMLKGGMTTYSSGHGEIYFEVVGRANVCE
jgi:hypothetical protein